MTIENVQYLRIQHSVQWRDTGAVSRLEYLIELREVNESWHVHHNENWKSVSNMKALTQ